MARTTTFEEIRQIFAQSTDVPIERVGDDPRIDLNTLGVDSAAFLGLQLGIEDTFEIEIPDEDAVRMTTMEEIVNYVNRRLRETGG